ncbi:unnamed protein product [Lepidochelys kempii]
MQRNSTRYAVASLTHPSSIYHHSTPSLEAFLTGHNQDTVPSHCSSALGISLWASVSGFCSTCLMKMIFAEYLVLSSLVLGVQLFLHQTQRIQFVEVNDTAKIHCSSTEDLKGGGWKVFWYLRREGEKPTCIKHCFDDQNVSKFACKHERHSSTLEISTIQKTESGIYYCAYKYSSYLIFGNGSSLIVGAPARECSHYIVPLAAGAGLLLLVVSLSLVWTLCPSTLGFQPRVSAPPASEEQQDGILYTQLGFNLRNHNGRTMQRSARGKCVKP